MCLSNVWLLRIIAHLFFKLYYATSSCFWFSRFEFSLTWGWTRTIFSILHVWFIFYKDTYRMKPLQSPDSAIACPQNHRLTVTCFSWSQNFKVVCLRSRSIKINNHDRGSQNNFCTEMCSFLLKKSLQNGANYVRVSEAACWSTLHNNANLSLVFWCNFD